MDAASLRARLRVPALGDGADAGALAGDDTRDLTERGKLVPAAGRKATAARRAGIRDEPYPEGAPTEGIEV